LFVLDHFRIGLLAVIVLDWSYPLNNCRGLYGSMK